MPDLSRLRPHYDVIVIGGGVHGAAAALEAVRLGAAVLLVERGDFCSSTSANSLKIIHGGLRYLQSLDCRRSRESAREQRRLLRAAPHLVKPLRCLVGTERSLARGRIAMSAGLRVYENVVCRGLANLPRGAMLPVSEARRLSGMNVFDRCTGAVSWYEAQVLDSERLVLTYLKTAELAGADVLNYTAAAGVSPGAPSTIEIRDELSGAGRSVRGDVVIDTASLLDPYRHWARAANLVLDRPFPDCALGLRLGGGGPDAGRLFFATPIEGRTLVGTWYFPDEAAAADKLRQAELERCLSDARSLLPDLDVAEQDLAWVHVGRLPVSDAARPLSLLEKPRIRLLEGGGRVVCVTGVKYTTAAATARRALRAAGCGGPEAAREEAPWYGAETDEEATRQVVAERFAAGDDAGASGAVVDRLCRRYGSAAVAITELAGRVPGGFERIPGCAALRAEILYCIEQEHCQRLPDFFLRRSGLGSLGPPPGDAVDFCAEAMAGYFGWQPSRVDDEIEILGSSYRRIQEDA